MEFIMYMKISLINLIAILSWVFTDAVVLGNFTDRHDAVKSFSGGWAFVTILSLVVLCVWIVCKL